MSGVGAAPARLFSGGACGATPGSRNAAGFHAGQGSENESEKNMISIVFVKERAQATRDAQAQVAAQWLWPERTLAQWDADITGLGTLEAAEAAASAAATAEGATLDGELADVETLCRTVVQVGRAHFRGDEVKGALFQSVRVDASGRQALLSSAQEVHAAWEEADAAWSPWAGVTLAVLGSALAAADAKLRAYSLLRTAWRSAAKQVLVAARALDRRCVAWYAQAIKRFPADTAEGLMIRAAVPTTWRPPPPVGQAEIVNPMASGSDVHLDAHAENATRYTFLQQSPGSPGFVVVLADSRDGHLTLHNQVPGVHRFKAVGRNSGGEGPESAIVEITVSQSAVA
jgi:hypothetical protein